MDYRIDQSDELRDIIRLGETQTQDFKHAINNYAKIAKTICAFANTDGGKIIVGVKDNGVIKGINPEEEKHMLLGAAEGYCKPDITLSFEVLESEEKKVLIAQIEPSPLLHYAKEEIDGNWKVYIRESDHTRLASFVHFKVLENIKKGKNSFIRYKKEEEKVLKAYMDNQYLELKELAKLTGIGRFKLSKVLINLVSSNVLRIEYINNKECFSYVA